MLRTQSWYPHFNPNPRTRLHNEKDPFNPELAFVLQSLIRLHRQLYLYNQKSFSKPRSLCIPLSIRVISSLLMGLGA